MKENLLETSIGQNCVVEEIDSVAHINPTPSINSAFRHVEPDTCRSLKNAVEYMKIVVYTFDICIVLMGKRMFCRVHECLMMLNLVHLLHPLLLKL